MIEIATTGDAVDFGDDTRVREENYASFSSSTRGVNAGGYSPAAFTNIGYSQSVSDLYPQQDKDNPNDNPGSSSTYASRSPLGEVSTSDQRHSLTRETADKFIKDLQIGNSITGIITSFTSALVGNKSLIIDSNKFVAT